MKLLKTIQLTITFAAATLFVTSGMLVAQTPDPLIGTWKLNVAKSKYDPGPAPKSGTATFTAAGTGLKVVIDGVAGTGDKMHWEYTANYDGKEHPLTGTPDGDVIIMKRISGRTTETTYKKAGKVTLVHTRVVSEDGKTLVVTTKGTNAQGQKVHNVQVFEKG